MLASEKKYMPGDYEIPGNLVLIQLLAGCGLEMLDKDHGKRLILFRTEKIMVGDAMKEIILMI